MRAALRFRLVLVTCGSRAEARRIARSVVGARLAACVNIVPPVESVFRWKGKLEVAREFLLLLKTSAPRLAALEKAVQRLHSYELPEFLVLPVSSGSSEYLSWLGESTRAGK